MLNCQEPSRNRVCATCEYWGGVREVGVAGAYVKVEGGSKGYCPKQQRVVQENLHAACSTYQKWGWLK